MTKAEVISDIETYLAGKAANATNDRDKTISTVDKDQILAVVEAFFEVIKTSMQKGENIYMRGFGSFVNKKRARKVARLITQKKPLVVDAHYIPSFKPSKIFLDMVKNSTILKEVLKNEENKA